MLNNANKANLLRPLRSRKRTKTMDSAPSQSIVHLVAPVHHLHAQNSVLELLSLPPMMRSVSRSKSKRVSPLFHLPQPSAEALLSQVQPPLHRRQYLHPTLDPQGQRNPLNLLRSQRFGVAELFESRPSPNLSRKQNQNHSNRKSSGMMRKKSSPTSVSKPKKRPLLL